MANSVLRNKSKSFAKDIVFLCRKLKDKRIESVLINQLLKSGTSVGANENFLTGFSVYDIE